jgi:UDP-glucuronate 4-epimerase
VIGLDDLNDYYDLALEEARLTGKPGSRFVKLSVQDRGPMADLFARERFERVIHLAAQVTAR